MSMIEQEAKAFLVDKNRRETIDKGTRGASIVLEGDYDPTDETRQWAESKNRLLVIEKYEEAWGPVPWERAQITHYHLSFQLVTTLLVAPILEL